MHTSPAAAIATILLMLLAVRFIFEMTLANYQSRKARKRYKASVPFLRRWFFLDAPDYVRDKYSKLERKVIKARALSRTLRSMNLALHLMLLPALAVILLFAWGVLPGSWGDAAFWGYVILCGGCLLLLALIEWAYHPNYERMRHGRKPSNW